MASDDGYTPEPTGVHTPRSGFRQSTSRRFDLAMKREVTELVEQSAKELEMMREFLAEQPLDEPEFTTRKLAGEFETEKPTRRRKTQPVFHKDLTPLPPTTKARPAIATEVLAKFGVEPRAHTQSRTCMSPIKVVLEGQNVGSAPSPDHLDVVEPIGEVHSKQPVPATYPSTQTQKPRTPETQTTQKPAIISSAGTTQGISYGERKKQKKYNVRLKKPAAMDSLQKLQSNAKMFDDITELQLLEFQEAMDCLSSPITTSSKSLSEKVMPNMSIVEDAIKEARRFSVAFVGEDGSKKSRKKMSRVFKSRRGTMQSITPLAPKERTVDDIVGELRAQIKLGGMSEADRRINVLVNEVMSRTGGETHDPTREDTIIEEDPDLLSIPVTPAEQPLEEPQLKAPELVYEQSASEEICVDDQEASQRTNPPPSIPPPISESTSTTYTTLPSADEIQEYFDVAKAWEDLLAPAECTAEDVVGVKGESAIVDRNAVSFLVAWTPADDTSEMDDDVIEVTKKHKREPIHHFCCTTTNNFLPPKLANISTKHHTPSRFNESPERIDVKSPHSVGKLGKGRHGSPHQPHISTSEKHVAAIAKRLIGLEPDSSPEIEKEWQQMAEQRVMEDAIQLTVTKMPLNERVSRIFWTMAPDKLGIPPSRVKEVLFSEYEPREPVTVNYNFGDTDSEEDSEEDEALEKERLSERNQLRFRNLKMKAASSEDLSILGHHRDSSVGAIIATSTSVQAHTALQAQTSSTLDTGVARRRSNSAPHTMIKPVRHPSPIKGVLQQDFYAQMKEVKIQKSCAKEMCHQKSKNLEMSKMEKAISEVEHDVKDVSFETTTSEPEHLSEKAAYDPYKRQPVKTPAEIAHEAGRKYVILLPKKKKEKKTICQSRVQVIEQFLVQKPRLMVRSESMKDIRVPAKKALKLSRPLQRPIYRSTPCLLDFDSFGSKRGLRDGDIEREFVRDIWNRWFEARYPPTPEPSEIASTYRHDSDAEDEEFLDLDDEDKHDFLNPKTESILNADVDILDDIGYLLDSEENKQTRQVILDEVDKVTKEITNASQPSAFFFARRGALFRRCGYLRNATHDLNTAISMEPQFIDAYWHRHLIYLTEGNAMSALDDLSIIITINKTHYQAYLSRAEIFRRMGDSTMALMSYTQAIRIKPDNHDAYVRRAQIYEKNGGENNLLLAMEDYSNAKKLRPGEPEPMMKTGQYYFNSKNWTSAINNFTELLNSTPSHIAAYIYRGRAHVQLNNWNAALNDFSSVVHLDPNNWKAFFYRACIYRRSRPEDAIMDYSVSLLINSTGENVQSFFHRGLVYCALDRYASAVTDFESVLKLDGNIASAQVNLGIIYLSHYKFPHRAIKKFSLGIRIDPTRMDAYALRAEAYRELHELPQALKDYTRAIHLDPTIHTYHMYRGQIILEMGDLDLAAKCVRHAAALNSNIAMGDEAKQSAIVYTFLKEYDKAIEVLRHATYHKPTPELYMLLGQTYMKAGQYGDAIEVFRNAINIYDPTSPWKPWPIEAAQAYYMVGVCQEELREFYEAHEEFNSAIRIDPNHAMAYYHRGLCRMKLRFSRGILDFNRALAINPNLFEIFLSRACYYGNKGLYCKAILNCNKALQLKPRSTRAYLYRGALKYHIHAYPLAIDDLTMAAHIDSTCALAYFNRGNCYQKSGMLQEAIKDYGIVLLLGKDLKLKVYINRGLLYFESGDYMNALADFAKASRISPKDRGIQHTVALCHHRLGKLEKSVSVFNTTIEVFPGFVESYVSRGNVFMDYGHQAGTLQAKKDYERALFLKPLCYEARINLALCLQTLGKYLQAWKQFTTILTVNPRYQAALAGRAVISLQMSDTYSAYRDISTSIKIKATAEHITNRGVISQFSNRLMDAMSDYQKAIKLDPKYSLAYYNAGNVYFHVRRFQEALHYYNQAIQHNPKDEGAFLNRAITKVMTQDSDGALEDFTSASKLSPKSAHIYFNRGNLYMSLLQYDLANQDYTTALSFTPDDALILTKRAEVRGKLGQRDLAIEDYKRAIDLTDA